MKKITFLLFTLITSFSFGQVVLSEDFEAGLTIPAGWTNDDIAVNGEVWTIDNTGEAGGYAAGNTFVYDPGFCVGNYATFDSDGYGDNGTPEEAALTSPVFSCAALTDVTLNFNHLFGGNFGGSGFVEVSSGFGWTTVATYTGDGADFGLKSIDVTTELAGQANAQIRFRWTGNWSLSWSVDNISVFECTVPAAPDAVSTPTPVDMAIDIPIDNTDPANLLITPFSWVAATTGEPADTFNLSLGITTTGDDIGTITGATNGNGINYTWDYNTTYYWRVDAVNCFGVTQGPVWSFTTSNCTATAAPNVATTPSPVDVAVDVPIDNTDPASLTIPFSWVDAVAGDPADSYNITIGITTTGDDLGTLAGFTGGDLIYTWEYSTTYYWKVDAVNCFGTTPGTVWSFTTEADPSLSTTEFNTEAFSVYPNPAKDLISIKSVTSITNAEVYNQLGQLVMQLNTEALIDKTININNLNNGIYFLKINAEGKQQTIKFIKE